MYAPNNIIPLSIGVRHTPNTSHISLCADMVSIKLSLEGKKDYLLRAKWSYPEEWSYPSYMIRLSVLISLEESRLNSRKSMMTASIMYHGCHTILFVQLRALDTYFWPWMITELKCFQSGGYSSQKLFLGLLGSGFQVLVLLSSQVSLGTMNKFDSWNWKNLFLFSIKIKQIFY